jgi:hypothetical protein
MPFRAYSCSDVCRAGAISYSHFRAREGPSWVRYCLPGCLPPCLLLRVKPPKPRESGRPRLQRPDPPYSGRAGRRDGTAPHSHERTFGTAEAGRERVTRDPMRETAQVRSEGRAPWTLRRPAGRGLSAAIAVREHPAPDRSSAAKAAATPGHEDRERMNDDNLTGEVRP